MVHVHTPPPYIHTHIDSHTERLSIKCMHGHCVQKETVGKKWGQGDEQIGKCLLWKHKDASSDSQHPCEKQSVASVTPMLGQRLEDPWCLLAS